MIDDFLYDGTELLAGYNINDNTWEVIVKYNGDLSRIQKDLGIEIEILSETIAIFTLDDAKIPFLYRYNEIEYIEKPKNLFFSLQNAIRQSCISMVHSNLGYNLTGNGVITAIIDSGIDYTHPDFRNADGTSRILYIWDQTASGRKPPAGFSHGVEYDNAALNGALEHRQPFSVIPELDTIGHGTAVAGVAAGNGRASAGASKGAAPEASIIAIRLGRTGERSFVRNTEFMRAIKYCIDRAILLNMPIAINISYGTSNGSHDGRSLFELYINEMSQRWKTSIVVATGNEGASGHHYSGRMESFSQTDVLFTTSGGLISFFITFWKNFTDDFSLELILPDRSSTGLINAVAPIRSMRFGNIAVYMMFGQPNHYNEDQEVFFQIKAITGTLPAGLWRIVIKSGICVYGRYNMWLPVNEKVTQATRFSSPDPYTTLTLPSTATNVISVGAYDSRVNSFADFSGRGYTRIMDIKPDIAAPGVNILTTRRGGRYDSFSGTSIAAPFVTGSAALMMQWGIIQGNDPFLFGQRIKAFLKLGAARSPGVEYPNPRLGYGTLCLRNSMDALVKYQTL